METNPLTHGSLTENALGIGPVSRKLLRERAVELAAIAGRSAQAVSKSDWEQAKRELSGGPAGDPGEAALEAVPETERWNPVPGSAGQQAPESGSEEEDDDGHNQSAQLVEEGAEEAAHDDMLQAARAARENERRQP